MRNFAGSMPRSLMASHRAHHRLVTRRNRSVPHLSRKIYHAVMGMACFSIYAFFIDRSLALWLLAVVGGAWAILDFLRLRIPTLNNLALKVFGPVMRKEELSRPSGNTFYVIGLLAVVLLFPKWIALLSVLYLALGDPTAAIVGTLMGTAKIPGTKKSVEGCLGNFCLSSLCTVTFVSLYMKQPFHYSIIIGLIGGFFSMLVEVLPLPLDDNFSIPTASGFLLWAVTPWLPVV